MKPELFRVPFLDLPVHSYGAMIVLGFLLSIWFASREVRRRGLPPIVYDLGLVMLLSGLVGARIFYVALQYDDFVLPCEHGGGAGGGPLHPDGHFDWAEVAAIWHGGLVFYGGAILGGLAGLGFMRLRRVPIVPFLDAVAPFFFVAMGFGRIGCVLNGCCFGGLCAPEATLGLSYPAEVPGAYFLHQHEGCIGLDAASSAPVNPVQKYEAGLDFLLCGLLWWYLRGISLRGAGMPLAFVLYGVGRFLLEYLRGDNLPIHWGGWTISQVVSLVLIGVFLPGFVGLALRGSVENAGAARHSAAS